MKTRVNCWSTVYKKNKAPLVQGPLKALRRPACAPTAITVKFHRALARSLACLLACLPGPAGTTLPARGGPFKRRARCGATIGPGGSTTTARAKLKREIGHAFSSSSHPLSRGGPISEGVNCCAGGRTHSLRAHSVSNSASGPGAGPMGLKRSGRVLSGLRLQGGGWSSFSQCYWLVRAAAPLRQSRARWLATPRRET